MARERSLDSGDLNAEYLIVGKVRAMADYLVTELDVDALRMELRVYEDRYRVPSCDLAAAFTHDGVLVETDDFWQWDFAYGVLRRRGLTY